MANERIYETRVTVVPAADTEVVYPGIRFDEGLSQKYVYHSRYRLAICTLVDLWNSFTLSRVLHIWC